MNPFAHIDRNIGIVDGNAFIGRENVLRDLTAVALSKGAQHIAMHGMPHVGKSSVLKKLEKTLVAQNKIVVSVTLVKNGFVYDMARILLRLCNALESFPALLTLIDELPEISTDTPPDTLFEILSTLLRAASELGQKTVILLDEFERAGECWTEEEYIRFAKILLDDSLLFSCIVAARPHISFVLSEYTRQINPFYSYLLHCFNESDMCAYFDTLYRTGISPLSAEDRQNLLRFCGRSPLLLTVLGNELVKTDGLCPITTLYRQTQSIFNDHFMDITDFMKEEERKNNRSFSHIVKCYFGVSADYQDIIESFIALGYIEKLPAGSAYTYDDGRFLYEEDGVSYVYVTVSHLFVDYLYTYNLESIRDTRDILTGLVHTLRDITKKELKQDGDDWNERVLLKLTGRAPGFDFVMPYDAAGTRRYIVCRLHNNRISIVTRLASQSELSAVIACAVHYRQEQILQRQPFIQNISSASLQFLAKLFTEGEHTDMPLLDPISIVDNGRIIVHYNDKFAKYFGIFGTFDADAHQKFLQMLAAISAARNKIAHFSRQGLSAHQSAMCRTLCITLLRSIYTYIATGKTAEKIELDSLLQKIQE